jgi:hypothetical protein
MKGQPSQTTSPAAAPSGWRQVVQSTRGLVPLIECCSGMGSGLLISNDGLIVTNRHVIDGANMVMVTLYDGTKAKGLVVHKHEYRDLALIRAAVKQEQCFGLDGSISSAQAGDEVLAIGHPRGLTFTATRGIVSESLRQLPNGPFVQHDVAINPGNSGGPLLDSSGALVGLNTQFQLNAQGLGFAIPAAEVRAYVNSVLDMIRAGKLPYPTDQEISATPRQISAADVLHAAAAASGLTITGRDVCADGVIYALATAKQSIPFVAAIARQWLDIRWTATDKLNSKHLTDATFLLRLIQWQTSLFGPRFMIADDRLHLASGRSIEGLDVAEAREMLLSVAEAVDQIAPAFAKYVAAKRR